ncbi:MAG: hypothetical protein JWN27_3010 [Candidatus Eremiobacteraeota bacterium]|jgi:hypothetical protein|nr:hypothetical protein [Candidatus Eremiobacteraeota bacterium]
MLTKFCAGVVLCASLAACSNGDVHVPQVVPVASPTPAASASPTPVATATPTPVATATPTPVITATPSPTPVPTATPTPAGVSLSPSALTFLAIGASSAQTVTASEPNYSGAFTAATTTCASIASIASGPGSSFIVTPLGVGSCSFTITDAGAKAATLSIGVTATTVGGS